MAEVINAGMRKVIKGMVVTCQTAQFAALMPKPKDFVTRLIGDVTYLSAKVQKLSDDINKLLESYGDIPVNYLMTQFSSFTGSLTGAINRVNTYTQNVINQTMSIGEETMSIITEITGDIIDTVGETSKAVASLGMGVAHTATAIAAQLDVAEDINMACDATLEWMGEGFQEASKKVTEPLNKATDAITNAKNTANEKVGNAFNAATEGIGKGQQYIENLIKKIRESMDKFNATMDGGFKDVTGMSSIKKGATFVTDAMKESGMDNEATQAVQATAEALSKVLDNFSISKVVKAFAGILTQSVIVMTGLDQLPPIDVESMLARILDEIDAGRPDLQKEMAKATAAAEEYKKKYDEYLAKQGGDIEYTDTNYKEFVKQYREDLQKQREQRRQKLKDERNKAKEKKKGGTEETEQKEVSAIKEVEKVKDETKKAKQADKLLEEIKKQFKNLKKEAEYTSAKIKSDWEQMLKQYKDSIQEIKTFFINGGDGDAFIDECCGQINKDCNDIKELCKSIGTQLVATTIKTVTTDVVGPVLLNPAYKLSSFWMDVKTIFKFIKDLITLIIDIFNQINKLARIMLNGLNSLMDIIKQLMELLGLKWFMDLIQSILDMFGDKLKSSKEILENTLSAVYYKDTDEYQEIADELERLSEMNENGYTNVSTSNKDNVYSYLNNKDHHFRISISDDYFDFSGYDELNKLSIITYANNGGAMSLKLDIEKCMDELEKREDDLVAYKSPILEMQQSEASVSELMDGEGSFDTDIKFIGWHFYHPDLEHTNYPRLHKRFKGRIIKKAAKTGNRAKGGVNMLHRKKTTKACKINNTNKSWGKGSEFYNVFFWYDYYTEDLEQDCFEMGTPEGTTRISSTVQTQNGTIVELADGRKVFVADNNVRHGDYVTVDGVKYKVK